MRSSLDSEPDGARTRLHPIRQDGHSRSARQRRLIAWPLLLLSLLPIALPLAAAQQTPPPLLPQPPSQPSLGGGPEVCATNVCSNGGSCFVVNASFECMCPPGFSGDLCEVSESGSAQCGDRVCPPGALCLAGQCRCPQGFQISASGCVSTVPALASSPCSGVECKNGGVCLVMGPGQAECSCPEGTAGNRCQLLTAVPTSGIPDPCLGIVCQPGQRCVSQGPLSVCVPGGSESGEVSATQPPLGRACLANPCLNNGTCVESVGIFQCFCPPGFSGDLCEVAESFGDSGSDNAGLEVCSGRPCGANGRCVTFGTGDFVCECEAGFTGQLCEVNSDDCAGVVCPEPGQVCRDGLRSYTCHCPPGGCVGNESAGCPPDLCLNQGTCITASEGPSCLCRLGFTGLRCEIPATGDDAFLEGPCSPLRSPCLNGGTCVEGPTGVLCDCPSGTTGQRCESAFPSPCELYPGLCGSGQCQTANNAEGFVCVCPPGLSGPGCTEDAGPDYELCEPGTCLHGGTCTPAVNQYPEFNCSCPPGFMGPRCEWADFDECASSPCHNGGRCLQRSEPSNYGAGLIPGVFVPEQASGFHCLCSEGTTGPTCEQSLNPCQPNPCLHGTSCSAAGGDFVCECGGRWGGKKCEEERSSCASLPSPCARKTERCLDTFAGPKCLCEQGWGGSDCSFQLQGCERALCPVPTVCRPFLDPVSSLHRHHCRCPPGKTGEDCSVDTMASFDGTSLLAFITNPPAVSYNLSFSFRTSIPGLLLVTASDILGTEVLSLSLKTAEELTLRWGKHETKLQLPKGTEDMTDGEWRVIRVSWSGSELSWSLAAVTGQRILEETIRLSSKTLPVFSTKFGGSPRKNTNGLSNMMGCLGDMEVSGVTVVPSEHVVSSVNVTLGCHRQEQCLGNEACGGHGECRDLWTRAECACERPWLGEECLLRLPAATFANEATRPEDSFADVRLSRDEEESLELEADVSFLLRTRAASGGLFYLGSDGRGGGGVRTFVAAELTGGQLHANVHLGGNDVLRLNGGPRLDDGERHIVRVHRHENSVSGYIDGKEVFLGVLEHPFPHPLLASHFYIGGHPPPAGRTKRQVNPPVNAAAFSTQLGFKGVMQDVRVNGLHVPFFPISKTNYPIATLGQVLLGSGVLEGEISDDACAAEPCRNGATCTVTFNAYQCRCIAGWRGPDCALRDHCAEPGTCPTGAECKSTPAGYLCQGPATLEPTDSALLRLSAPAEVGHSISFRLRTRSSDAFLLYAASRQDFLLLTLRGGALDIQYRIGAEQLRQANLTRTNLADGEWHAIRVHLGPDQGYVVLGEKEEENVAVLDGSLIGSLNSLFEQGETLVVGAVSPDIVAQAPQLFGGIAQGFKGCISNLRLGEEVPELSLLAPDAYGDPKQPHFQPIQSNSIIAGCQSEAVCGPDELVGPCQNNARCRDLWNARECECMGGFEGGLCEVNIDECAGHACSDQGRCVDGIASYTCACAPGYEGRLCERETNECASLPCQNGGTCEDQIAAFDCKCSANFTGDLCEFPITVDCDSSPCMNGASCSDSIVGPEQRKSFECACRPGYFGRTCDFEVDYCASSPCLGGSTCVSLTEQQDFRCVCRPGYTGRTCDADVNECASSPCSAGGSCVDGLANFTCVCRPGWSGVRCEEDVDECQSSPCESGGSCLNTPGGYNCNCPQYYLGRHCEVAGTCLTKPCLHGECLQTQAASHSCNCEHGYTGEACETEIDYCESAPCQSGGSCFRKLGGFDCQCPPGFTGLLCEVDIDECESSPCENGAPCTDGPNSFHCECSGTGYEGQTCSVDVDECLERRNCEHGSCVNREGTYDCRCQDGYIGARCAHRDPCSPLHHPNGSHGDPGPSAASLTAAQEPKGKKAVALSACANHGRCLNSRVEGEAETVLFDCDCREGFTGKLCADQVSPAGSGTPVLYIVIPILGVVLLIAIIVFAGFFMVARRKRANRGTYSPSRQELSGARVPMGPMCKPPPQERLI